MALRHNSPCIVAVWPDGKVEVFSVTAKHWIILLKEQGAVVHEGLVYDKTISDYKHVREG